MGRTVVEKTDLVIDGKDRSARAFKSAAKNANELQERFTGARLGAVGFGAAVGVAGAALVALTFRSIRQADAIGKVADKIGATTQELQEFRFGAELAGVGTRTLDLALQRASRRIGEAAQGTGELKDTLLQYGVEVLDAEGRQRSLTDVLGDYAEVIKNAGSDQERLRLAFKAFDSEGAALVNLFRDGRDGVAAFRAEAQRLGVVLDDSMIRQAERANDSLTRVERILSVNLQRVFIQLAPTIERMGIAFGEAAPKIREAADGLIEFFFGIESISLEGLRREVEDLKTEITDLQVTADFGVGFEADIASDQIAATRAQIRVIQDLIQKREEESAVRKALFATTGAVIDQTDEELQKKLEQRQQAFLDSQTVARLTAVNAQEDLLRFQHEQQLARIEELQFTETAARLAKMEAETIFQQQLTTLREEQQTERNERILEQEQEQQQALQDLRSGFQQIERDNWAGHLQDLLVQMSRNTDALSRVWNTGWQGRAQVTSTVLGGLANLMDRESKKQFKIWKALAIAQATVDTFSSANSVFNALSKVPPVPFVAIAGAATATAIGLANVAKIATTKFDSGGSGGGGGGGAIAGGGGGSGVPAVADVPDFQEVPAEARPQQLSIEVTGARGGLVTLEWVANDLIPLINEARGDGATVDLVVN